MVSFATAFVFLHYISSALAVPTPHSGISSRQDEPCHNLANPYDESCWQALDLSGYLTKWNQTTPICTGSKASNCCRSDEPWSTCFLRLARGAADKDCHVIGTGQACSFDKDQAVDISIASQVHYVLRNIYAINNLFTSWYTALNFASNNAQLKIQSIVTELDPPQEQNVFLNQILTALSIGLSFIGGPQAGALVSAAAATAAQTFVKAVQQAPTVAAALWPSGTENSQSIQISNLESDLSLGADQLADIANRGLELIMSDMPSFIAFAQSGAFSGEKTIALPDQSFEVTLALKTYILTTAMTANKWKAHALPYSKEQIPQNSACTFDSNNICGEYTYYSDATQRVYTLTRNGYTSVRPNELMNDIIDKKWADLALMFDGAYECTLAGRMGQDPFANFGVGGDFSTACVSQLNFCIGCSTPCPVPEIEGVCPFGRCVDVCD